MSVGPSLTQAVPGVAVLRSYRAAWLRKDIVAGLILTALLVPQGMAYAELAGLPPITGLYTSILCLVGYAVFGPSRVLVLGPDSSLGPMIAACVIPPVAANGDPGKAVAYASVLALMVGAVTVLAGVFKLGFVADLLSKPTQIGYMNGLALTIVLPGGASERRGREVRWVVSWLSPSSSWPTRWSRPSWIAGRSPARWCSSRPVRFSVPPGSMSSRCH
jgi:MFS superfamily sulfate permease-like transporter